MSKRQRSSSSFSSSSESDSSSIIVSNEDLLTEILIFLPVRSVTRFQLVSKQWRSIISSPSFLRLHTRNHHRRRYNQPSFLLHRNYGAPHFYLCRPPNYNRLLPFQYNIPRFKHVNILQSCNGLLLLECFNRYRPSVVSPQKHHYIFNPTTGKYRDLKIDRAYHGLCLAFDPSQSPHYRVFCFKKYNKGNNVNKSFLTVYNSETHSWSKEKPGKHEPKHRFSQAIYWKESFCFLRSQATRRRFSLGDEKLYQLDYHLKTRGMNNEYYTVESNGHLHSVGVSLVRNHRIKVCVYELSGVDSGLTRVYDADHPHPDPGSGEMSLLGMVREKRILDSMLLFHVPGKVLLYRLITKSFEVVVDFCADEIFFMKGCLQFRFQDVHHFIHSFALV